MSPSTLKHKKRLWWLVFIPLLLVAGGMAYWLWQQGQTPPPDPRLESLERLVADSALRPDFYFEAGFPRWFSGRVAVEGADSVARARAFLERYKELYGLSDPNLELAVQKTGGENDEFVFFYQTYQGFEVYAGQILVMLAGNEVIATLGPLLPAGLVIDTSPLLEADQAEKLARERLEAPTAVLAGPTTPVIFDPVLLGIGERAPRLAWRVAVRAAETWNVLVDAQSGEILDMDKFADFGYTLDLEDANYNSAENSSCYWTTTDDDWIGDEDGILEDYLGDVDAVNTWWHARNAYAFYANNFNVAGYDTEDSVVEVYVHAGIDNGRWSEGAGCDLIEFADGWVGWDGMVHEYTHGVISHTSQLANTEGETGALGEAFSDTMAMLADPDDWSMGEDRTNGQGAFRWYDSPLTMDFYDANKGQYFNMAIPCTAGYRLSEGGLHNAWYDGVGRHAMVELFYNVMVNLPNGSGSTFMDARNLAVSLAVERWAPMDACAVKNAFASVGLGEGDWECDGIPDPDLSDWDKDWHIDAKDNCPRDDNPLQEDLDQDGLGDVCDNDDDNDLVTDSLDNCRRIPNPGQEDFDNDRKGDLCDDEDADNVLDFHDNCLGVANTNQKDKDQDGAGDACDGDLDGDGVDEWDANDDPLDNCPFASNPDQVDSDGDGIGDGCDDCPNTADEVSAYTNVPDLLLDLGMYPQPYQPDSDGDGVPDACDNSFLLNGIPWEKEKLTESGTFVLESKQPGKGAVERVPLPTCDPDRDGWFSQGARQRLVFGNPEGVRLGAWVTDETGRSVANPKMAGNEIVLEFRPWGGREYFLNFIQPAEQTGGFNVELLLSCYVKDLPAGSIITPVPFNPDVVSTLVPLTLTAHVPTLTFTPTLTLTPTLTYTPTLTLTATPTNTSTPRPWPTWTNTFTPTLEPPVTNDCGQYTTRDTCLANPACTWIDFAAMSACVNK